MGQAALCAGLLATAACGESGGSNTGGASGTSGSSGTGGAGATAGSAGAGGAWPPADAFAGDHYVIVGDGQGHQLNGTARSKELDALRAFFLAHALTP